MAFVVVCDHLKNGAPTAGAASKQLPSYRGIDRDPWGCVDDLLFAGKLAAPLVEIRQKSRDDAIGNFSPGSLDDHALSMRLLAACESGHNCELVTMTIAQMRSNVAAIGGGTAGLGWDCYVDGYGSLLALGIHEKPSHFSPFHGYLNQYGLFNTCEAMEAYVNFYRATAFKANIEPPDQRMPIVIYDVLSLERLNS